jgi:formate--tetrahydrofolate ligase
VVQLCEQPSELRFSYDVNDRIVKKLTDIATKIYHADGVDLSSMAARQLAQLEDQGFGGLPICVAKTQYSFSDDQSKLGAPRDFRITVRSLKVSAGAGFIVALTGDIMTMPGLPAVPAAERIDVTKDGRIVGLF